MFKKISRFFSIHPWIGIFMISVFFIILAMVVSMLPVSAAIIIAVCILAFLSVFCGLCTKEQKKGKMICEENLKGKVDEYTNLINEVIDEEKYERSILNTNWIQKFNQAMYHLQPLSDFGVAACLVYSLTWDNDTDESILFAFDCAKRIISEPKEYGRGNVFCYDTWLKMVNEKVDIHLPDETFTAEALASIIRAYLKDKTTNGIRELSNFLRILYLKCK